MTIQYTCFIFSTFFADAYILINTRLVHYFCLFKNCFLFLLHFIIKMYAFAFALYGFNTNVRYCCYFVHFINLSFFYYLRNASCYPAAFSQAYEYGFGFKRFHFDFIAYFRYRYFLSLCIVRQSFSISQEHFHCCRCFFTLLMKKAHGICSSLFHVPDRIFSSC